MTRRNVQVGDTVYIATLSARTQELIAKVNSSGRLMLVFRDPSGDGKTTTETDVLQAIILQLIQE